MMFDYYFIATSTVRKPSKAELRGRKKNISLDCIWFRTPAKIIEVNDGTIESLSTLHLSSSCGYVLFFKWSVHIGKIVELVQSANNNMRRSLWNDREPPWPPYVFTLNARSSRVLSIRVSARKV